MTDYATLDELKEYLRIDDDVDNTDLQGAISTASAEIDHLCSRTFSPKEDPAVSRFFEPWYDRNAYRWVLPVDDIFDETDLALHLWNGVDDYDDLLTGWTLVNTTKRSTIVLPESTTYAPGGPYDSASAVKVTGKFGWEETPAAVKRACLILATRIHKRRESAFGLVNTLDGSEQTRLTRTIDPDAANALKPYIRYWAIRR